MGSANIKDIKRRIKSVESTMQITKAMELVASSKLRRAKDRASASKPYFDALYKAVAVVRRDALSGKKDVSQKHALVIAVAGDRGLAGGFNHNVLKLAEKNISSLSEKGFAASVLPIGKKAQEHFKPSEFTLYETVDFSPENVTAQECMEVAEGILKKYFRGEFSEVYICYTTFVNTLSQVETAIKVLPLSDDQQEAENDKTFDGKKYPASVIYDPDPETVLNTLLPKYFAGILYGAIVESYAAEQAARRTAMESATDNAQEMIDTLSLEFNRARQALVTKELTEIVSGSMMREE